MMIWQTVGTASVTARRGSRSLWLAMSGEGTIEVGDEGRSGLSRMQFRRSSTYNEPNGPDCAQTIWSKYAQIASRDGNGGTPVSARKHFGIRPADERGSFVIVFHGGDDEDKEALTVTHLQPPPIPLFLPVYAYSPHPLCPAACVRLCIKLNALCARVQF